MNALIVTTCCKAASRVLVIALCAGAASASAQRNSIVFLPVNDVFSGRFDVGQGINSAGQVAGTVGVTHQYSGVVWPSPTTSVSLSSALCCTYTYTYAYDINNAGWVAGVDTGRAALWINYQPVLLPGLGGGNQSAANGVNDAGQAVGNTSFSGGTTRATLWDSGHAFSLGTLGGSSSYANDINSSGVVVGSSEQAGGGPLHATRWQNGVITDLTTPGSSTSEANAVNDGGKVVGYSGDRAALWSGGSLIYLSSFTSRAYGINNRDQVVGWTQIDTDDPEHYTQATLWNGSTATDLNTFLSRSDRDAGWYLEGAVAINDLGWITGTAFNNQTFERSAFLFSQISAVPEATTLTMWLAGLGLLGIASRRRTRVRAALLTMRRVNGPLSRKVIA